MSLTYKLNPGGASYFVEGWSDITGGNVVIDSLYQNLPVTSIGPSALSGCPMASITIPDSVTSIGGSAFYGCTGLTEINYNATECADLAGQNGVFYNAGKNGTGITVTIGANVKKIPAYLFYPDNPNVAPKITSVVFEEGSVCESIGNYAFNWCEALTSITIPANLDSIGDSVFAGCNNLMSVTFDKNSYLTSIGQWAFSGCSGLTNVAIPDRVLSIGYSAFNTCSSLMSITIGKKVKSIGSSVFANCSSLMSVTIPASVTSIGNGAFRSCSSLTTVYYSGTAEEWNEITIGSDNDKLTSATIYYASKGLAYSINADNSGYTVSGIGTCTDTEIVISPTHNGLPVTSIGASAFNGGTNITSITIPDSVTSIGGSAFYDCDSLTSVTIPDSVTSIGEMAFYNCSSLTSVTIGNSVTNIGGSAFAGCSSLTSINVGENNQSYKSIDGNLYTKDGATLIQYAKGKTETSFVIPESVTSIGDDAFNNCSSLTSVTIPDSVRSIGNGAFYGCDKLKQLILFPSDPPTFSSTDSTILPTLATLSIYVPRSSQMSYKNNDYWKKYKEQIISDNMYLSFIRFNQKNKKYIDEKIMELKEYIDSKLAN